MQNRQTIQLEPIFWSGSISGRGFKELLTACEGGNYRNMAISPLLLHELVSSGRNANDIIREAEDHQVVFRKLDGVSSWVSIRYPSNALPAIKERFNFSAGQCLDMAEEFGIPSILVVGAFESGMIPENVLIESFGRFCDDAALRNISVELEFIPYWGISELVSAWNIVRTANRPNKIKKQG
jgi:4-hydroxyphenylpyruvate dioxygenase